MLKPGRLAMVVATAAGVLIGLATPAGAGMPEPAPSGSHWDATDQGYHARCADGDVDYSKTHASAGADGVEICTSDGRGKIGEPEALIWVSPEGDGGATAGTDGFERKLLEVRKQGEGVRIAAYDSNSGYAEHSSYEVTRDPSGSLTVEERQVLGYDDGESFACRGAVTVQPADPAVPVALDVEKDDSPYANCGPLALAAATVIGQGGCTEASGVSVCLLAPSPNGGTITSVGAATPVGGSGAIVERDGTYQGVLIGNGFVTVLHEQDADEAMTYAAVYPGIALYQRDSSSGNYTFVFVRFAYAEVSSDIDGDGDCNVGVTPGSSGEVPCPGPLADGIPVVRLPYLPI